MLGWGTLCVRALPNRLRIKARCYNLFVYSKIVGIFVCFQMVGFPELAYHLKSGWFANRPLFTHLKFGFVQILDPHSFTADIFTKKKLIDGIGIYSGDLNSKLVWYSDHGDLFYCQMVCIQMPSPMEVWYSDHHLVNGPVFRPPFEYRSTNQMPGTMGKVKEEKFGNHKIASKVKGTLAQSRCRQGSTGSIFLYTIGVYIDRVPYFH